MPKYPFGNLHDIYVRTLQTIVAIMWCYGILRLTRFKWMERLSYFGAFTLWVYIGHTFIVVMYQYLNNKPLTLLDGIIWTIGITCLFTLSGHLYTKAKQRHLIKLGKNYNSD